MSRRKAATKRVIIPDPLFGSELIAKFINVMMKNGKKSIAEKIVYRTLEIITKQYKRSKPEGSGDEGKSASGATGPTIAGDPMEIFRRCLDILKPTVEVRPRRVGGATYQVPVEVPIARGLALAMRWLVEVASARSEKTMAMRLANEIMDALSGKGGAIKKRDSVHSMAKANQAFAHFRW